MAKIIDENPDPSVVKKVICSKCGVTIAYVPLDVKTINGTDYSGGPDGCDYIICLKCKHKIILRSW